MFYRKRPVVVEAFKYEGDLMNSDGNYCVPRWCVEAHEKGIVYYDSIDRFNPPCDLFIIKPLEGNMLVNVGDYIIKGVNGELYPCKPDIFEKTYEKVEGE